MSQKPILKGKKIKVRILRPNEYERLREGIGAGKTKMRGSRKVAYQANLDACLLLGARYRECLRIQANPNWFDGNFIHLPWIEELAQSRHQPERWIRLSSIGKVIIPYFLQNEIKLPSVQAWDADLKCWSENVGLGSKGITARTLRKTYESWLVFSYPDHIPLIFLSQGHNQLTALHHYINLPFTENDKEYMKKWVEGWI